MPGTINKSILKSFLSIFLLIVLSLLFADKTYAASLSLLPSPSTVSVGDIISERVSVNTEGQSINTANASIQFPTDMVEVVSITKSSSVFTLWVEEPSFSNNTGQITFDGGVPNPGFNGQSGNLVTITFRAKKQGTASIIFTDGAVRANDGMGTDILNGKFGSTILIGVPKEIEVPSVTETPKVTKTETVAPVESFNPNVVVVGNQNVIIFDGKETISDLDYYTIQIDDNPSFKVNKDELNNGELYLPVQSPGSHALSIVAFSKKGNYVESTSTFISPAISIPVISLSSEQITSGESVIVYGKTDYPGKQVNVVLESGGKELGRYTQTTKDDGSFSVITDKIKTTGSVSIWAETVLSDSIKSQPSEKLYLKVNETPAMKITFSIVYPIVAAISVIVLLLILIFILYSGWHKFFSLKKRIENESKQTIVDIHKAMLLLKDELNDQLSSLEKVKADRKLNEKEEAIFTEIEKNVDGIEDFIEKKLKKMM